MSEKENQLIDAFASEDRRVLLGVVDILQKALARQSSTENFEIIERMFLKGPITDMMDFPEDTLERMEEDGLLWSIDYGNVRYWSFTDHGLTLYVSGELENEIV